MVYVGQSRRGTQLVGTTTGVLARIGVAVTTTLIGVADAATVPVAFGVVVVVTVVVELPIGVIDAAGSGVLSVVPESRLQALTSNITMMQDTFKSLIELPLSIPPVFLYYRTSL